MCSGKRFFKMNTAIEYATSSDTLGSKHPYYWDKDDIFTLNVFEDVSPPEQIPVQSEDEEESILIIDESTPAIIKPEKLICSKTWCLYQAPTMTILENHEKLHGTTAKVFTCRGCHFMSLAKFVVTTHMAHCPKISASLKYKCKKCSYVTVKHPVLNRHYLACHGTLRYCHDCEYASMDLNEFKRHCTQVHRKEILMKPGKKIRSYQRKEKV